MSATLEAGHFYLYPDDKGEPQGFEEEQKKSVLLGVFLARRLGIAAKFLLFVDDYHGNPNLQKSWETEEIDKNLSQDVGVQTARKFFEAQGVSPQIFSELELTTSAIYLYSILLKRSAVAKGKRNLTEEFCSTVLLTQNNQPSCSLIDAALYLKKIGSTKKRSTITILPIRYKQQQQEVKQILKAVGVLNPPILIIYHDEEGNEVEQDDWSKDQGRML